VVDPGVPAALEDVKEADEVGVDVRVGVLDRVADSGLGGEVDDDAEAVRGEEGLHLAAIGKVDADKDEAVLLFKPLESGLLEGRVVVVVEVVEADDLTTLAE